MRLGIIQGEYHWHKHDLEDECFIVLDGELLLDIEGKGTITLTEHLEREDRDPDGRSRDRDADR